MEVLKDFASILNFLAGLTIFDWKQEFSLSKYEFPTNSLSLNAEVQEFEDEKTQVDFQFDRIFLKYYFLVKSQVVSFSC